MHRGIDRTRALGHHVDLGAPERAFERVQLAVRVADADVVGVDQCQTTDAASRQRLDRPRTDAADADDADVRRGEARGAAGAVQAVDAAEAFVEE